MPPPINHLTYERYTYIHTSIHTILAMILGHVTLSFDWWHQKKTKHPWSFPSYIVSLLHSVSYGHAILCYQRLSKAVVQVSAQLDVLDEFTVDWDMSIGYPKTNHQSSTPVISPPRHPIQNSHRSKRPKTSTESMQNQEFSLSKIFRTTKYP